MYRYDNRVVITLDAGGTNLVFGAMQANKFIVDPITLPSNADNLDKCLATMVEGFQAVIDKLEEKPVAISFAFPGPADYPNGIIGGYLPNFPSFREGVALGPFLEYKFGIPVFINNDGDLFSYGEALGGALPEVNARLEALGSPKRYKNLVGYTFGTGLGIGIVVNNRTQPRRQLVRRDLLSQAQEDARHYRRRRRRDPRRETRLRRVDGQPEPRAGTEGPLRYRRRQTRRRHGSRPHRLSPRWARSPATPWLRP